MFTETVSHFAPCFGCVYFSTVRIDYAVVSVSGIDLIGILTVGLERACSGGSCGEHRLNLKRFPRISLGCMLVPVQP